MGFLDSLKPKPSEPPKVGSILPDAAKKQIVAQHLPVLVTNKILLKTGETCHYADKCIYEKKTIHKRLKRKRLGYSMPGLFKGDRLYMDGGNIDVEDNVTYSLLDGILYITNKRIIFVGNSEGFDKSIDSLIALIPYANCIVFQFSKNNFKLFVPDGSLIHTVLQLIK